MPDADAVELLPFYCPIASALNPAVDQVEADALAWLAGSGLYTTDAERAWLFATNSAEFYARITPAADPERLQLAARWCYWGFAFDDARCDNGPASVRTGAFVDLASRSMLALMTPGKAELGIDDPFVAALADIAEGFRGISTPTQLRRWTEAHRGWLLATAWQVAGVEARTAPGLADYVAMRLNSCAGEPTTAMIEIVNAEPVPAVEMDSPAVRAATEAARLVAAFDNDLVSAGKERRLEQGASNIVDVLARTYAVPLPDAVVRATALRDRVMVLFLALCDRIGRTAGVELASYLDGLGHTIRGNIEWSLRVPRYTSDATAVQHPGSGRALTPGWADQPSDASLQPIGLPAISWWWDQLG